MLFFIWGGGGVNFGGRGRPWAEQWNENHTHVRSDGGNGFIDMAECGLEPLSVSVHVEMIGD